ncbi:MAG TPA: hypothetical protein VH684_04545 [Xanthobacteraceae bacterium]|jgi:hypothetical protein
MTDFAIHPPIHIAGRQGAFVRSTAQAADFVREQIFRHPDDGAAKILYRLEKVNSAADAQRAANAFRAWIGNAAALTGSAPTG